MEAAFTVLQNFIDLLVESGLREEDARNRAFDLAVELVQFKIQDLPKLATPESANIKLRAAYLLRALAKKAN